MSLDNLKTHSQNSMTGEVAFTLIVALTEVFLLRNSTQFSVENEQILHEPKTPAWTSIMDASVTCVPGVVAGWPGQVPGEGVRQVENPPGQNNNVVEVQQSHYDLGTIAKTCEYYSLDMEIRRFLFHLCDINQMD